MAEAMDVGSINFLTLPQKDERTSCKESIDSDYQMPANNAVNYEMVTVAHQNGKRTTHNKVGMGETKTSRGDVPKH